jgi:transposase
MDPSEVRAKIKAVEGGAGASATDPRILFSLWLYATLRKVGSAREVDRRCREDFSFQWLCGGVTLNYHTLADFRTDHGNVLDKLLTTSVAVLLEQDLVTMDRVAQDGMRVRASAGASSFRRGPRLQQFLAEAEEQVASLKKELEEDPTVEAPQQRTGHLPAKSHRS